MTDQTPSPAGLLDRTFGWLSTRRAARDAARERDRVVAAAVEKVVEDTDRRIRAVGGYQRKLAPAVRRTLDFADELVGRLPGPLDLSRRSWQDDSHVNAFFGNVDDLRQTLTRSKELREFFQREGGSEAYALLTMTRQEKSILGMSLQGETVQREVPQTSVSFVDHRVLAPGATEAAVRAELKTRALNVFISHVEDRLLDLQVRREGLERERQILQLRLRLAKTRQQSLAAVEDGASEIETIEKGIAENARALEAMGGELGTLDHYIEHLRAVFEHPEEHLRTETVAFRVNRMGIKLDEGAAELGNDLTLLELSLGPLTRVATLVRCPRKEMLSLEQFLGQVNPHLASQMGIREKKPE